MTPLLGACFGGAGFGQTVARASRSWVHDIKVETLARCGAGWQPARRLATAAVRCQRGIWPIDNRPQLAKLPHKSPRCLAYTYARIQAVLLMNRLGVDFCVAHPLSRGNSIHVGDGFRGFRSGPRFRTGDVSETTIKAVPGGGSEDPRGIPLLRNGSGSGVPPRGPETRAESFPPSGSPARA